jgi:hypothetical protein
VITSILSTVLLVTPAPLPASTAPPPSLVNPKSGAWTAVHAGQLWVCWEPGPDCFERVAFDDDGERGEDWVDDGSQDELPQFEEFAELEAVAEPAEDHGHRAVHGAERWQLGFGVDSLWIELGDRRWRVMQGQQQARSVEDPAPVWLRRIGPARCGPAGVVPAVIGGRMSWRQAPRCANEASAATMLTRTCMAPGGPQLGRRRPTRVRIRAGLELKSMQRWTGNDDATRGLLLATRRVVGGTELHFVVELGFDGQRRSADDRARAALEQRSRAKLRDLPPVAPGPLAAAELDALETLVCGGQAR